MVHPGVTKFSTPGGGGIYYLCLYVLKFGPAMFCYGSFFATCASMAGPLIHRVPLSQAVPRVMAEEVNRAV